MELNLWNIREFSGSVELSYQKDAGRIEFHANMSEIVMLNPHRYVHGYPEVFYGYKPWTGHETNGKLPEKIAELESLKRSLDYTLWHERDLPINFAMEGWITTEEKAEGAGKGDVELMVWLYSNQLLRPAGGKIKTITVPIVVNGTRSGVEWEVWLYYNALPWDLITFRLRNPIKGGDVELDIVPLLSAAKEVFEENPCRVEDFEGSYLEDWEIGTEFGSPHIRGARFGWEISELKIDVKKRGEVTS